MKNVFALALICYVAFWGAVAEPVSASESSPRPVLSNKAFPAHVLLAKKGTSTGRTTSTLTLNNVRHHAHKKYTRVVFDLTGRVEIKERKNQRIATISLPNVTLSKRVQQQIKRKDFPRAIVLSPEKASNRQYRSGLTNPPDVQSPHPPSTRPGGGGSLLCEKTTWSRGKI